MLFRRWNEAKLADRLEQAKAEGKAEGVAERDRQWAAWNNRRIEAEAKGEPFHEPPPHP